MVELDEADARTLSDVTGRASEKQLEVLLDVRVLSAPTVKEPITACKVTFAFGTVSEAEQVAADRGSSAAP